MASMSKTQLIGNLGADPEVRYMPDGTAVATLSRSRTDNLARLWSGRLIPRR
jgi:single-strand DNA-binding protein